MFTQFYVLIKLYIVYVHMFISHTFICTYIWIFVKSEDLTLKSITAEIQAQENSNVSQMGTVI